MLDLCSASHQFVNISQQLLFPFPPFSPPALLFTSEINKSTNLHRPIKSDWKLQINTDSLPPVPECPRYISPWIIGDHFEMSHVSHIVRLFMSGPARLSLLPINSDRKQRHLWFHCFKKICEKSQGHLSCCHSASSPLPLFTCQRTWDSLFCIFVGPRGTPRQGQQV